MPDFVRCPLPPPLDGPNGQNGQDRILLRILSVLSGCPGSGCSGGGPSKGGSRPRLSPAGSFGPGQTGGPTGGRPTRITCEEAWSLPSLISPPNQGDLLPERCQGAPNPLPGVPGPHLAPILPASAFRCPPNRKFSLLCSISRCVRTIFLSALPAAEDLSAIPY